MLVWRFRVQVEDPRRALRVERAAARLVAAVLVIVSLTLVVESVRSLSDRVGPDSSAIGVSIAIASLVVLPVLAVVKLRLAARLDSPGLHGDGVLTVAGAVLASAVLIGLLLDRSLGWWWCDPVAALLISVLVGGEGGRTLVASRRIA